MMMEAIDVYRRSFRPSPRLARPRLMLGVHVIASETDDEARFLLTSLQQAFVNLRSGRPTRLPPPVQGYAERLPDRQAAMLADILACAAVGSPDTVRRQLKDLIARTEPYELILTAQIHDHALLGDTVGEGRQRTNAPAHGHVQPVPVGQRVIGRDEGVQVRHRQRSGRFETCPRPSRIARS